MRIRVKWVINDCGSQDFVTFLGNRASSLTDMGSCGGSQNWALELQKPGHKVRWIQWKFVKAFITSNENDVMDVDAWQAICCNCAGKG